MKQTSFHYPTSSRQAELQRKIYEALELNETRKFSALKSQWVHRYGFLTLPKELSFDQTFQSDEFVREGSLDNQLDQRNVVVEEVFLENASEQISFELQQPLNDFEGVDSIAETTNASEEDDSLSDDQIAHNLPIGKFVSPPPSPHLSHFRRWLPGIDDEVLRAS